MRPSCIALGLLLALPVVSARAHAFLLSAVPAVGASVRPAPSVLRLNFSEGLELLFSRVTVTDPSGRDVPGRNLRAAPDNASSLLLDMPALPAGTYRVHWRVVSVDTHITEGVFSFTVRP